MATGLLVIGAKGERSRNGNAFGLDLSASVVAVLWHVYDRHWYFLCCFHSDDSIYFCFLEFFLFKTLLDALSPQVDEMEHCNL